MNDAIQSAMGSESIVTTVRQSLSGLIPKLIFPGVITVIPFLFLFPLMSYGSQGMAVFTALLVIGVFLTTRRIFIWQKTMLVVSDKRIIDIDQRGILSSAVSAEPIEHINDIYYKKSGLWQALFRSGSITIIMNNSKTKIEFKNAPNPEKTVYLINDLQSKFANIPTKEPQTVEDLTKTLNKIKRKLGDKKYRQLIDDTDDSEIAVE